MTQPLLDLGDVRLVLERVRRGGGPEDMHADEHSDYLRIPADELVDAIAGERPVESAGAVVADWAKEGTELVVRTTGGLQVIGQQLMGASV